MIGAQERHAEPSHEASQARSRLATHPAVLWQFRNSHFNEQVRWTGSECRTCAARSCRGSTSDARSG